MTDFSGQSFGHYRLQERIGSGGYADVYKAFDFYLGRHVAVKVLKERVNPNDLQDVLRNAQEARTAARLKHPHIVAIIDFNIQGDIPYIVMEYAKNGSLRHMYPRGEPLAWETIIDYVRQITEALTFTHAHGIVHQDVKPENLLLSDNNEVLVSDFGTVAFIQQTGPQNAQVCIGTPGYMAPERFTDDAPTPASDVYSLAVVIFEWLTGESLFSGSRSEIIRKHRFAIPSTRRMATLGVAPALQRVLLKALAKNPLDRYQNVRELYTALVQAASVPDQHLVMHEQRTCWEKMSFIFIATLVASPVPGIGLYLVGVKLATDVLIFLACLLLLPILSALLWKNWVAVRLALVIPVVAALLGLLLHSWLVFGCLLPILLVFCVLIGLLRG